MLLKHIINNLLLIIIVLCVHKIPLKITLKNLSLENIVNFGLKYFLPVFLLLGGKKEEGRKVLMLT